jgi:hypothetical protein
MRFGTISLLCVVALSSAQARDPDGRYAGAPLKSWFDSLRSSHGPCCSDADGNVVLDADWESVNDAAKPTIHYRVRIRGEWVDVDDAAVITTPNLDGRTIVWPYVNNSNYSYGNSVLTTYVRCFMPGPGM